MTSLPGDRARSARLVARPYPTAANAHTSATTTPWSDRKSDKETSLECVQEKHEDGGREAAARAAAESIERSGGAVRSLPRNPEPSRALRRAGALRLALLARLRGRAGLR